MAARLCERMGVGFEGMAALERMEPGELEIWMQFERVRQEEEAERDIARR